MKALASFLILGVFLLSITGMPGKIRAYDGVAPPHERFSHCGNRCQEDSCGNVNIPEEDRECPRICQRGYYCVEGYAREYENGPCILAKECRPRA